MGPLVRIGLARECERRPGFDEAAVLRVALDVAARELSALSARSGAGAAERLEFQLALLEDDALIAPAFAKIAGGAAADFAWRAIADDLIREYGADPSEYVRARCLDVVDLRDRVLGAVNGDSPAVQPAPGAIVAAEDLPPSRFLEIDWSAGGEFLFLGRNETPDEEAQLEAYLAVLRWAGDRPVTIRTVGAGGDKAIRGFSEEREANPFLGLRGMRLSLRRPEAFATQLRSLGRAAVHGHLKVMFPMVTAPAEFEAGRARFAQVVETLKAKGFEARLPELGMMVEVPAAAMTIADFDAAFYSIGANDLTQFVMASDRGNGAVSHLYDPTNPAVLELIRRVVDHGRAKGRNVSLCGDVAGDPARTLSLMKCGLRELSMSAGALAGVKRVRIESPEARLD